MTSVAVRGGRFAITGGLSLLGGHIREQLLAAGAESVIIIDNLAFHDAQTSVPEHPRVRFVHADVRDTDALVRDFAGAHGVFHTAAFVTIPLAADPLVGIDVNVRGTATVLEAASRTEVAKVVLSSSVARYGEAIDDPITEESPLRTTGLQPAAVLYGASKVMAEALCERATSNGGPAHIALRYSSLYDDSQRGRGLNAKHLWEILEQMTGGGPVRIAARPDEMHDYLFASDAAAANVRAMEATNGRGAYTIATGRPISLRDAARVIAGRVGYTGEPEFVEQRGRLAFSTSSRLQYDVSRAAEDLRWRARVGFAEGVDRMIRASGSSASEGEGDHD